MVRTSICGTHLIRGAPVIDHAGDLPARAAAGNSLVTCLIAAVICLLITACERNNPDDVFRNYLERLGRTLDLETPTYPMTPLPSRPRTGELQLKMAPGKLGTLDFLAISGCAVQVTIGKRNSSLGRMAKASQRLLLELEYLSLAPECIAYQRTQGREELALTLEEAWQLKRQQLPALLFNATLGSDEYRNFWSSAAVPADYPAESSSAVITALEAIHAMSRRWLSGDFTADNLAFELALGEIALGDGGALLSALARQDAWLRAANDILTARLKAGPLCQPRIRPAAANILPNVVSKYFIGEIQAHSAALGTRYHQLLPPLMELETTLSAVLPREYQLWRDHRDKLFNRFYEAPAGHVKQLQAVLAPCQSD